VTYIIPYRETEVTSTQLARARKEESDRLRRKAEEKEKRYTLKNYKHRTKWS